MHRRLFLSSVAALACVRPAFAESFEVSLTEAEWRAKLTDLQYQVLREEATEAAGSSALNDEQRKGVFACAGCDLPLFASEAKYDSGTGWPSFFQPLPGAVGTKADPGWFGSRTEVHCRRCGGHLGHVFDDGPQPTGKRYCMNGAALKFLAA
ncbi:MAG: peptide-methionine (R)-S-oxide reductase [Rhodobacteraceae bacterium]|uniref:peptide-methionine (R)-S-oxide reductase MsrB n=1 Tax=Cypionkella sp. TaxID=2811411 RepID=UPI0013212E4A|nr:peptide-methionine (R)-S-oxide reductase MsrB [Cypionkella sp.]KAF0172810.1 MAG: peptide-methionine (R)-S-oxide reductase [Paracoccaceae bacterium]MDO8327824.1 peptide-methionine (R)-S-oxide reductase MsrB [Cypionkella sp.]